MKKIYLLLIIVFVNFYGELKAQEIIPFRMNGHYNIIVKSLINEKDSIDLMFQIAMQDASLAPNRKKKVESIKFDTSEFSEGLSKVNTIQVANTKIDSIWIWDNEYTGYEAEGKIGTQLFKGKIFKINYDHSQFELYDELPVTEGFVQIPLNVKRGQLFVNISSFIGSKEIYNEFLLQSGFSGAIIYNNQISDENHLSQNLLQLEEKTMSNSAGQKLTNLICRLPDLKIAGFEFKDIPVGIFTGEIKNQPTSYMGADLIHRFNWIFDTKAKVAYIQKNKYFEDQYYFNKK